LVVEVDDLIALGTQAGTEVEAPKVHDRNAVHVESGQVLFDGSTQLGGLLRRGEWNGPGTLRAPTLLTMTRSAGSSAHRDGHERSLEAAGPGEVVMGRKTTRPH
jgi:hypothetical protein